VTIFASVSASIDRNATASGTNGLSRYGEFFISVPVIGLLGQCPRSARAPGASNASQGRAGFFPSRVFYPPRSRHKVRATITPPFSGAAPACDQPGVASAVTMGTPDQAQGQRLYDLVTVLGGEGRGLLGTQGVWPLGARHVWR
jgi:hypothetical protein